MHQTLSIEALALLQQYAREEENDIYTDRHVYTYSKIFSQMFWLFWLPFKENPETNDTSFESPNTQLIESEIKFGRGII